MFVKKSHYCLGLGSSYNIVQLTCCSCFKVEAVSSPLATARILAAREAPLVGAGGRCPLDTILIESFLPLSSG